MAQAAIAQINVRLPKELKETGDAGLRALGISPSDAVRALWTRLSSYGEELTATQAFLFGDRETDASVHNSFDQSAVAEGWRMVDQSIQLLDLHATPELGENHGESDNDLLVVALEERMRERGLM